MQMEFLFRWTAWVIQIRARRVPDGRLHTMRRFAGATLTFALILAGCCTAYLWIFHGWAASTGPASTAGDAQRAWHHAWSVRFLVATCAFFVTAAIWGTRRRWWHPKHVDFRWTSH